MKLFQKYKIRVSIIFLILLFSAAIRILGLKWGMPYAYHPDERLLVARGIYFFSGDFNPHLFIYPSFQMYILFVINLIVFVVGYFLKAFPSLEYYINLYHQNPTLFYMTDRFITVLFAVASIYITYKITRRYFGKNSAYITSFFFAILPVHVMHSEYVTTDVPSILFILLSFSYSLRILDSDDWSNYLLAGIFGGFAAGIKYNAGLIVICIFFAHLIRNWVNLELKTSKRILIFLERSITLKIVIAVSVSILVYLLTTPFTLLDFKAFFKDFLFQVHAQRRGHGLIFIGVGNKLWYQLFVNLQNWGGSFLLILILGAYVWTVSHITKYRFLILSWITLYFIAMLSSNDLFIRYTLPIIPFVLILVGDFCSIILKKTAPAVKIALGLFTVLATLYMLIYSSMIAYRLAGEDVRTIAKKWFEENATSGSTIGIMMSSTGMGKKDDPPIDQTKYTIFWDKSLTRIEQQSPDWIIMSSYDYVDFLRLKDRFTFTQENYKAITKLMDEKLGYRLAREFDNTPKLFSYSFLGKFPIHDMMYNFPVILIYKKIYRRSF